MYRALLSILFAALVSTASVAHAVYGVTQCALPTSNGGTVDCTVSGFGTPVGAIAWGSFGTANGTAVVNHGFFFGGYDGTRQNSMATVGEDNVDTSNSGFVRDTNSIITTLVLPGRTVDSDCTASFITDGIRLTCADAPPSAYLANVLLFSSADVAAIHVNSNTGSVTLDGTLNVTDPGFQGDLLIVWSTNFTGAGPSGSARPSIGFATRVGGLVQRSLGFNVNNAAANQVVGSRLATNRIVTNPASLSSLELSQFTATGFDVITRDVGTGPAFGYMDIQFTAGRAAKLMTSAAPTATGNAAVTGAGFQPQAGLMLQGEIAAVDTDYNTDDGEVFAFSAFTGLASATASIFEEDGNNFSDNDSMTDTKVCRTRKDGADYATCTLSSLDADGATFNYTATNGTARQRVILFLQSPSTRRRMPPIGPF